MVREIIDSTTVLDACIYPAKDFEGGAEDVLNSGLNAFFLTVPHSHFGFREAVENIAKIYNLTDDPTQRLRVARTVSDIKRNSANDIISVILYFQDPLPIENRIEFVRAFYELGVRVIQLTYNQANYLGSGCPDTVDRGLTDFGREVVQEMNRLGIIVDLSHCSKQTALDAIKESKHPCLFSHANIKSISDSPRNKTDEEIKLLAEKGGVIGLTPWAPICWKGVKSEQPTLDDYLDHVEYAINLVGIDHVGYASDGKLDHSRDMAAINAQKHRSTSIVGQYNTMVGTDPDQRHALGFQGSHQIDNFVEGLLKRGYTEGDAKKILGGNFLRVMEEVWKPECL